MNALSTDVHCLVPGEVLPTRRGFGNFIPRHHFTKHGQHTYHGMNARIDHLSLDFDDQYVAKIEMPAVGRGIRSDSLTQEVYDYQVVADLQSQHRSIDIQLSEFFELLCRLEIGHLQLWQKQICYIIDHKTHLSAVPFLLTENGWDIKSPIQLVQVSKKAVIPELWAQDTHFWSPN